MGWGRSTTLFEPIDFPAGFISAAFFVVSIRQSFRFKELSGYPLQGASRQVSPRRRLTYKKAYSQEVIPYKGLVKRL